MLDLYAIKDIQVKERKRRVCPDKVREIAASIDQIGLINPITLTYGGVLVAGMHRLEAFKSLGQTHIPVSKKTLDDLDAELVEIDENLKRSELNDLELGRFLQRRNEILEAKGERARVGENQYSNGGHETVSPPKTTEEIAEGIGLSKRAAQQKVQMARDISPEVQEIIEETGNASSTRALLDVARMPKEEQEAVGQGLKEGKSIKEAVSDVKKPHVVNNSGNNEWYTPLIYIDAAREVMGSIDTDPASCQIANQTVKATTYYTKELNGLTLPWSGNVWMNPPYGQPEIVQFCEALKAKRQEFNQAIVLVNNATETGWFQTLLSIAEAICLPKSRIRFLDETGQQANSPIQGQTFFYFGPHKEKFKAIFKQFGGVLYVERD